jgi:hypothetical protein
MIFDRGWGAFALYEVSKNAVSTRMFFSNISIYEAYSESKYSFAVKISIKVSYKILLLSNSTFFKLFFHIFAAIIDAHIVAGHKFLYVVSS